MTSAILPSSLKGTLKDDPFLPDMIDATLTAARAALDERDRGETRELANAEELRGEFMRGNREHFMVARKDDGSSVTSADLAAHEAIAAQARRAGVSLLSEESATLTGDLTHWQDTNKAGVYWVADPVDGTSNLIRSKKTGEMKPQQSWAVSIGRQDHGVDTHGVIYVASPKDSAANGLHGQLYISDGKDMARMKVKEDGLRHENRAVPYPDRTQVSLVGGFLPMPGDKADINGKYSSSAASRIRDPIADEKEDVTCACADMMRVANRSASLYAHGAHYPWDIAAAAPILKAADVHFIERQSPCSPLTMLVAGHDPARVIDTNESLRAYYGFASEMVDTGNLTNPGVIRGFVKGTGVGHSHGGNGHAGRNGRWHR